jgi:hypothetical protein
MIIDNNTNAEEYNYEKGIFNRDHRLAGCKPSADKAVELAKKRSQPIQGILIAPSLDM